MKLLTIGVLTRAMGERRGNTRTVKMRESAREEMTWHKKNKSQKNKKKETSRRWKVDRKKTILLGQEDKKKKIKPD
jgi:hypothetical protein